MKCITCGQEAEYVYLGNSYCEEHKNRKMDDLTSILLRAEKTYPKETPRLPVSPSKNP